MPVYAYKCNECSTKYEVFHKSTSNLNEVVCPSCGSENSKKLMSATNFSGLSSETSYSLPQAPSCSTGGCASGMCNLN